MRQIPFLKKIKKKKLEQSGFLKRGVLGTSGLGQQLFSVRHITINSAPWSSDRQHHHPRTSMTPSQPLFHLATFDCHMPNWTTGPHRHDSPHPSQSTAPFIASSSPRVAPPTVFIHAPPSSTILLPYDTGATISLSMLSQSRDCIHLHNRHFRLPSSFLVIRIRQSITKPIPHRCWSLACGVSKSEHEGKLSHPVKVLEFGDPNSFLVP